MTGDVLNPQITTTNQFRPTIVIFVGETADSTQQTGTSNVQGVGQPGQSASGQSSIYEHFSKLIDSLDPVLQPGISLLAIEEGSQTASELLFGSSNGGQASAQTPFASLLRAALSRVQGNRLRHDIEAVGYTMSHVYPQIYIVGRTQSAWINTVADMVNTELDSERAGSLIIYVLIDDNTLTPAPAPGGTSSVPTLPPGLVSPAPGALSTSGAPVLSALQTQSTQFWAWDLLSQQGAPPKVDYCFLYENREGHDRTYVDIVDMRYGLAEALLALVGTDISSSPLFTELTRLPIVQPDLEKRIGCLGTSRVLFPRQAVEDYCSNILGVELLDNQSKRLKQQGDAKHTKALRTQTRERAKKDAKEIEQKLWDHENDPRPYAPEFPSPSLSFMEDESLQQQLLIDSENLFQLFDANEKMLLTRREQQAQLAFFRWQGAAVRAWGGAGEELRQQIEDIIQTLLREDDSGTLARLYADQLDEELDYIRDHFMRLRIEHKDRYAGDIDTLRALSSGPWEISTQTGAITQAGGGTTPPQATPGFSGTSATTQNNPPLGLPPQPPASGQGNAPASMLSQSNRIPPQIVKNLEQRVLWLQARVPTIANLIGAGLVTLPPLALLLFNLLFPISWAPEIARTLEVLVGLLLLYVLIAWGMVFYARRRVRRAEDDLLRMFRRHFAYQCEQWEDKRRIVLLGLLISFTRQMRSRLLNMAYFVEQARDLLQDEAVRVENELFSGPQAYRDVFIGDRQVLNGLNRKNRSLAVLNERLRQIRQNTPQQEWHQSNDLIDTHLQQHLQQQGISIISTKSPQELVQPIFMFCQQIISAYLQGDITDLNFILQPDHPQSGDTWKQMLRMATVLYLPDVEPPEYLYLCGQYAYREALASIVSARIVSARNTSVASSLSSQWLMVVRFWTGGSTSRWTNLTIGPPVIWNALPQTPNWP